MIPLAVYPDQVAAVLAVLGAELAARAEPYAAGAHLGTRVPTDRTTDLPGLPYVLVAKDSDTVTHPVISRATIRVTVWHDTAENATDLAQLCHGLLLAHTGPVVAAVAPLTGPIPAVDTVTALPLATFTVAATTRADIVN